MSLEMDMKSLIGLVSAGTALSEAQAEAAMTLLFNGEATSAQAAAFLVALRMKGETVDEIVGCARVMRARATRVPHGQAGAVDTCGTGGDHSGSFNISTTAAFVVAGAGIPVAKHGNRAASSQTGSADVLEALGMEVGQPPEVVGRCIDEVGLGFMFAPAHHPAMKHIAAVRREIALRTIFNLLGPLTNPAGVTAQVVGVFRGDLTEPLARVLGRLGAKHALVVHGLDGLDELSIAGPTVISEYQDGYVTTYRVTPEDVGLQRAPREYIRGGGPADNARIVEAVLKGERGPRRDVVLLNASAALVAADRVRTLREGIGLAETSIDNGRAWTVLERLRAFIP